MIRERLGRLRAGAGATRKAVAPDGTEWEISVLRLVGEAHALSIRACSFYPVRETYYWRAAAHEAVVAVEQIVQQLAAGVRVPRPGSAVYVGTTQA